MYKNIKLKTIICFLGCLLAFGKYDIYAASATVQDNYLYAIRLMNSERYQAAIVELKNILTQTNNPVWVSSTLYLLGKCYYELQDYTEARQYLTRVQKNYPKSKFINFVKELLNELDKKTAALQLETSDKEQITEKIMEFSGQQNPPRVEQKIVIDENRKNITIEERRQVNLTEEDLERVKRLERYVKEGNDYFALNKFEQALDAYQRAYAIDRDNSVVKYNLAVTHLRLENFADANYFFEDVYKRNPEDREALKYVAFTYMKLNKPALAYAYWVRLLRLDPNNQIAQRYVKELEKMVKQR